MFTEKTYCEPIFSHTAIHSAGSSLRTLDPVAAAATSRAARALGALGDVTADQVEPDTTTPHLVQQQRGLVKRENFKHIFKYILIKQKVG